MHGDAFACQVCHSQNYKSCNGCHVGEGITGSSYETFKIGYNPLPDRPEKFVVLRHIPIVPDTYTGWGLSELSNFDTEPTWKFATPHNIRRRTDRTPEGGSCGSACHNSYQGPTDFFLRAADLEGTSEAEQRSNADVIVPDGSPFSW
jgi:thiosulfate/3-mercaptopyruvate sulfurtransferase